jgi:hypothetical protein
MCALNKESLIIADGAPSICFLSRLLSFVERFLDVSTECFAASRCQLKNAELRFMGKGSYLIGQTTSIAGPILFLFNAPLLYAETSKYLF